MKKITKKIRSSKNLTVEQMKSSDGTRNDRRKDNKKAAFTLAEVLITLAIVGVVAAMTIPTLISKCQKVVWAKQAQKEYATWTQAFKRILAENNTTSLSETEVWSKIHQDVFSSVSSLEEDFFTELGKYVKFSIINLGTYDPEYYIVLPNGARTRYFFYNEAESKSDAVCEEIKALGGSMCNEIGYLDIDINGDKGPNEGGRDNFIFYISDEGNLYPYGGKDYALYYRQTDLSTNTKYWKNRFTGNHAKIIDTNRTGQLMDEGWKMNY
jgi:prepilin-type N-terminal cleavage/methylation domain-containing protein